MNSISPSPDSGPSSAAAPTSLAARLFNVYAAPGDVFEEVKASPMKVGNWLVPLLLAWLVGIVVVQVMFSQPTIREQIFAQQQQKLDAMVAQGKLTQEQADQGRRQMESFGVVAGRIVGSVGVVVVSAIWLFLLAVALKLLAGLVFHRAVPYLKAVEIVGLASMVTVLGGVVNLLLMIIKGSMMATLGPSLLVPALDPTNQLHQGLASVNLMTLWYVGVLAAGLAKLSGVSFAKAAAWLYGGWVVLRGGMILIGWAATGM